MIQVIAEHSVDISLLPKRANILDLGCHGMEFSNYFNGHKIFSVDLDEFAPYRFAVSDKDGRCGIKRMDDRQAWQICEGNEIPMMTLKSLSSEFNIRKWHLVKMDIEGSEISILSTAIHPIAKQISVEFHAHLGQTKEQLDSLLNKLEQYYIIHNKVWEERYGAGFNYWDILMIAK